MALTAGQASDLEGVLKENRVIGTRYDKLAANYEAMVQVALIHSYLRHLHPSDRA